MRRRTMLALVAGGAAAGAAVCAVGCARIGRARPDEAVPDEDAIFTVFAPGGKYGFWCNGPVGWAMSKLIPIVESGVHRTALKMLDLQPDDDLLDIGCGPGAFLARAGRARLIVGLDPSPLMLGEATRRLADRIAAGTARVVPGNAAALPFEDAEFSAVTAIFAPVKPSEVFRVLHPNGRFVFADPSPRKSSAEPASSWAVRRLGEDDYRRMFEEAGFTDLIVRVMGDQLFVGGRKPSPAIPERAVDIGAEREPALSHAGV